MSGHREFWRSFGYMPGVDYSTTPTPPIIAGDFYDMLQVGGSKLVNEVLKKKSHIQVMAASNDRCALST